ncbi:MAG: helix-turn-helix domain-containing protein [Phycisphaerales bacterium JB040]
MREDRRDRVQRLVNALVDLLEIDEEREPAPAPVALVQDEEPSWRERLWTCPPQTRLTSAEAAEALGRPVSFIYKRTSGEDAIPHRKLDGSLQFVAAELRRWIEDRERDAA